MARFHSHSSACAAGGTIRRRKHYTPPTIAIDQPTGPIAQQGMLQFTLGASRGLFSKVSATLEQNGKTIPLFDQAAPEGAATKHTDADHVQVTRPIGKAVLPDLQQAPPGSGHGGATVVSPHSRVTATASKDIQIRLSRPNRRPLDEALPQSRRLGFVVYRDASDVTPFALVTEYRAIRRRAGLPALRSALKVAFSACCTISR